MEGEAMKLNAVRLWVDDMGAARVFYETTLGLRALWDHGPAVGYDLGAALIVELDDGEEDEPLVGRFTGVSLEVADIAAAYAALMAKGVEFLQPPETMPWGGALAHFKDPAGNVLTLVSQPG
jgi:predicted enzyme related to lactoylglutathione lyase